MDLVTLLLLRSNYALSQDSQITPAAYGFVTGRGFSRAANGLQTAGLQPLGKILLKPPTSSPMV
jgi:hypothetical protein